MESYIKLLRIENLLSIVALIVSRIKHIRPSVGANVFRYVGKAHATYMKEKSIATVEEYVELLKTKNSSAPLSLGNKVYAFYVANTATAAVSSKYAYTVSGNNIDGYIVTVDTNTPLSAATN